METINIYSRYYNELTAFKSMLLNYVDKLFEKGVLVENYINSIEPTITSSTIFNHIIRSLNDNGYSDKEKILLINNLMPTVESFGNARLNTIESRIELLNKLGIESQHIKLIKEYNKTISAVKDIQELLVNKLIAKQEHLTNPKKLKADNIGLREIALKYYYEGLPITKGNADNVASEYGYNSYNSGHKLYQHFNYYYINTNRRGQPSPFTLKKLENKIKLFEKVMKILTEDKRSKALDEVNHLKATLDRERM